MARYEILSQKSIGNKKLAAYWTFSTAETGRQFIPIRPTGRWKIVNSATDFNTVYIEHQGLIFKRWIPENDIDFRLVESEEIFECSQERATKY